MNDDAVDGEGCNLVPHTFNETTIIEIEYEGSPVFLAQHVGAALGYADPKKLTGNITEKWSDDFEEGRDYVKLTNGRLAAFKALVNYPSDRRVVGPNQFPIRELVDPKASHILLLTEAGAQLAAILSRTPQGRSFRRWLLDEVLPAYRTRHAPPPAAPSPATEKARGRPGKPKAISGPRAIADHFQVEGSRWEQVAARRFDKEGWVNPYATAREHLVGRLLNLLGDLCGPPAWHEQLLEAVASQAGLTVNLFEGDRGRGDAQRLAVAQRRDLVDRMTDAQLAAAVVFVASQVAVSKVVSAAGLQGAGWRWTPAPDAAEELARVRAELARANQALERLGGKAA